MLTNIYSMCRKNVYVWYLDVFSFIDISIPEKKKKKKIKYIILSFFDKTC